MRALSEKAIAAKAPAPPVASLRYMALMDSGWPDELAGLIAFCLSKLT